MDYKDISVIKHGAGQGMDITFLNGKVSIPDEYGGYTVSCGCGGGKTTAITQIIWQNSDQGVVYLVDTVAELEKMYNSLLKLIAKYPMAGLTKDDIFCIRANRNEKDGDDDTYNKQLKAFKNDVSIIHRKKILLLTHVRFFSTLTPDFLMYSDDPDAKFEFDGDFGNLMKSDNIRKYILIDETPNQWLSVARISRLMLRAITDDPLKPGDKRPFKANYIDVYEECCEGGEYDILKGSSQFKKQRKDTILKAIPYELVNWEDTRDQFFQMYFLPSHLIQVGMKCHVLLFEGKHGKTKCARFQKRKAYFPTKNEMRFEKHFISIKKASEHKFQMPFFFSITSDIQVEFDILGAIQKFMSPVNVALIDVDISQIQCNRLQR